MGVGGEVQSDPPSSRNFQGESPSLICTLLNNLFTTTAAWRKENLAFSIDIYLQLHVLPFVLDVYSLIMNELNKWKLEHAFPSNLDIQFFIGFTAIIAFEVYHKRSVKALAWNNYPFHAYQHLCHQSKSKPSQKSVYFICITLLKQINYPSIWWQSFSSHKSRFMYKE